MPQAGRNLPAFGGAVLSGVQPKGRMIGIDLWPPVAFRQIGHLLEDSHDPRHGSLPPSQG